jgi:hypothetical protein
MPPPAVQTIEWPGGAVVHGNDDDRNAERLLLALERGGVSAADTAALAEDVEPVLVYVIVSFLRQAYPASDPAARSVLDRVVRMTSASRILVRRHDEGGRDPVARWFESEHSYADFRGRGSDLVALIADKLGS